MTNLRAAIFAALFLLPGLVAPGAATAQDVTLTARDGSIELHGMLLGYDGEFYRIETDYGVLTVDGSGVNCDGPGCPGLGPYVAHFTLSGAREMGVVLMPALIEGFALRQGYALKREEADQGPVYTLYDGTTEAGRAAVITIRQTSSGEGFADLIGNAADIVLSLREISAKERDMAYEAGLGDLTARRRVRVVAMDALVPMVAPGNPFRHLSMRQLAEIYSGQVTDWAELGGEPAPITAYLSEPDEGFGDLFAARVAAAQGAKLSPEVIRKPTNAALIAAVEADPFGIGIGARSQSGNTTPLTLSGECGYELRATRDLVKAEDYPLAAPMYLYLPARRLPRVAREFLAYLRTDAAQVVIRRAGLIDRLPGAIRVDDQGWRLANAIRAASDEVGLDELKRLADLMIAQSRLTVTFRFDGGAVSLDAPSRANVSLLAHELATGHYDGATLTFVGFSDGVGDAHLNQRLALRRARAVRDAVLAAAEGFDPARTETRIDAFGEALPMACDDSAWGRRVNRRVEVWITPRP